MAINTVSVIGLGYIGLPSAVMLASKGKSVLGVDLKQEVVDSLNSGKAHIEEPLLQELLSDVLTKGNFSASLKLKSSDVFLIAVPTPLVNDQNKDYPKPDLSYIREACHSIAKVLKKGDLVILESTSPVGTTELVSEWLSEERKDLNFPNEDSPKVDINIAYCPERVLPGNIIEELVKNDRIIGGLSENCTNRAKEFYEIFVEGECQKTDCRTAEMTKLTENSFRDVQIAFANELSLICDDIDVNVDKLISFSNKHPRVNILKPGPGVGGHCIAVDPWFIVSKSPKQSRLIAKARKINNDKPNFVIKKINEKVAKIAESESKELNQLRFLCLGLSFKADIEDLRESPSLLITKELSKLYPGQVSAVEPNLNEVPSEIGELDVEVHNKMHALPQADLYIFLVAHKQFLDIDISRQEFIDFCGISQKLKS